MTEERHLRGLRVLFADDNVIDLEYFSRVLKRRGHNIRCCTTGAQALEILAEEAFDVIIIDNIMPQMSGLELVVKIREMKLSARLVVTSGFLNPEYERKYQKLGIKIFLPKPAEDEEIFRAVEG